MELTTLQDYVYNAKKEYDERAQLFLDKHGVGWEITFEDEELIFAILDYHSMKGEFTPEELKWLDEEYDLDEYQISSLLENN